MALVRVCTHYFAHGAWLDYGQLLRDVHCLNDIPGVLIQGRLDLSAPLLTAWELAQAWPDAELMNLRILVTPAARSWGPPGRDTIAKCVPMKSHSARNELNQIMSCPVASL
jgi:proline iminopeptidase